MLPLVSPVSSSIFSESTAGEAADCLPSPVRAMGSRSLRGGETMRKSGGSFLMQTHERILAVRTPAWALKRPLSRVFQQESACRGLPPAPTMVPACLGRCCCAQNPSDSIHLGSALLEARELAYWSSLHLLRVKGVGGQPRPLQSTQFPARPGWQTHSHSVFTISYNKYSNAVRTTVATGWHVLLGAQVPAATGQWVGPEQLVLGLVCTGQQRGCLSAPNCRLLWKVSLE